MAARANYEDIVSISVIGEITAPRRGPSPYSISHDGQPQVLPGTGGIVYNVRSATVPAAGPPTTWSPA